MRQAGLHEGGKKTGDSGGRKWALVKGAIHCMMETDHEQFYNQSLKLFKLYIKLLKKGKYSG